MVDIDTGTGEHALSFGATSLWPMQRLQVDKGIGELEITQLGNGSPQVTRIVQAIGLTQVDLSGAWLIDADVEVQSRLGELVVGAPDRAQLKIADAGVLLGEHSLDEGVEAIEVPAWAPTVTLRARLTLGALQVDPPAGAPTPPAPPALEPEVQDDDVTA